MKNQKGYVQIVLIIFAVLIGLMIFPQKFPTKSQDSGGCVAGTPGSGEILVLPAVNKDAAAGGGWLPDKPIEFIQVRQNLRVLNSDKWYHPHLNWTFFEGGTEQHNVKVSDGIPEKPGYEVWYPGVTGGILTSKGDESTHNQGLMFFRKKDPSATGVQQVYTIDVYQEKEIYDKKTYSDGYLFSCVPYQNPEETLGTTVVSPRQQVSQTKDQLQLEWFLFQSNTYWSVHCKPAVYLYPQQKQLVNVKVFPKGELVVTDPPYDEQRGWTVEANPDGGIYQIPNTKNQKRYPYLYYESKLLDSEIKKPTEGWVVSFDKLDGLFSRVLPKLGLNPKEQKDFSGYWLKTLPKSSFYFVGLIDKEQRDYLETLDVTPSPDTSIRFSLYFEPLDQPGIVSEPVIRTPKRTGFTLVDWGGMIKLHPGTPFTCSQ